MSKIEIRSNETAKGDYLGDVVDTFEGTQSECEAYFEAHYDMNDYTYNFTYNFGG